MWRFQKLLKCLLILSTLIGLQRNEVFSFKINPKDVENQWSVLVDPTKQPGLARTAKNCGTSINRFYDELDNIKNQTTAKLAVIKDPAEIKNLAVEFKKQVVSSTTSLNEVKKNVYKLAGHFKDKYKNGLWSIEIDSENTFDKLNEMKNIPVDNTKSLPESVARLFGNRHDYEKLSNKMLNVSLDDQQLMDDFKKKRSKARAEFSSLYNVLDKWTKNTNNIGFKAMSIFVEGINSIKSIRRKVKEFKEGALSKIDENELAAVQNAIELAKALKFIFEDEIPHDSDEILDEELTADNNTSAPADDSNEENNFNQENKNSPEKEVENQKSLSGIVADSTPKYESSHHNLDLQTSNESSISNSFPSDTSNVSDNKFSPLVVENNIMTKKTSQENPNDLMTDSPPTSEQVHLLTSNELTNSNLSLNDTSNENDSKILPLNLENDTMEKQTTQENSNDLNAYFIPKHENLNSLTSNESTTSNSFPSDTSNVNDTTFSPLVEETNIMTKKTSQENPNDLTPDSLPTSEQVNLLTSNESTNFDSSLNDTSNKNDSKILPFDIENDTMEKQTTQENPNDLNAYFIPKHEHLNSLTSNESTTSNSFPSDTSNVNDTTFSPLVVENNIITKKTSQENPNDLMTDSPPTSEQVHLLTSNESTNFDSSLNDISNENDSKILPLDIQNIMSKQTSRENPKEFAANSTISNPSPNDTSSINVSINDHVHSKTKHKQMRRKKKLLSWDELIRKPELIVSSESKNCVNALNTSISDLNSIKLSSRNVIQAAKDDSGLKVAENDAIKKYYDNMKKTNTVLANILVDVAENACETVKSIDDKYETKFKNDPNLQRVSYLLGKKYDPNYYILQVISEAGTNSNKNGVSGKKKPSYYKMVSLYQNLINETNEMDESALYAMNKIYEGLIATKDLSKEANRESAQKALYILRKLKEDENEEDIISKTENQNKVQEKMFDVDSNNVGNQNENHNLIDNLEPNKVLDQNDQKDLNLGDNTNNKQIAEDYPGSQDVDDEDNTAEKTQRNDILNSSPTINENDGIPLNDSVSNLGSAENIPTEDAHETQKTDPFDLDVIDIEKSKKNKIPDIEPTNKDRVIDFDNNTNEIIPDENIIKNESSNEKINYKKDGQTSDGIIGQNEIRNDYVKPNKEEQDEITSPNFVSFNALPEELSSTGINKNIPSHTNVTKSDENPTLTDSSLEIDKLEKSLVVNNITNDSSIDENTEYNKSINDDTSEVNQMNNEPRKNDNMDQGKNKLNHNSKTHSSEKYSLQNNSSFQEDYINTESDELQSKYDTIKDIPNFNENDFDDQPTNKDDVSDKNETIFNKEPEDVSQDKSTNDTHNGRIAKPIESNEEDSMNDDDKPKANFNVGNDNKILTPGFNDAVGYKPVTNDISASEEYDEDDGKNLEKIKTNTFKPSLRSNEEEDNIKMPKLNGTNYIIPTPTQDNMPNTLPNGPISNKVKKDSLDDSDEGFQLNEHKFLLRPNENEHIQQHDNDGKKDVTIVEPTQSKLGQASNEGLSGKLPNINEEIYNEDQENDNSEKIDSVENAIPSLVQNQKIVKPVQSSEEYDKDDGESNGDMKSNEDTKSIHNTPETTGQSRNEMDPYNDKIATDQVFENVFDPIKSTDKIERDNLEKPNLNRTHNTILPQNIIPKINEELYNEDQENDNSEKIDSVENAIPSLVQNQKIMKPVQSSEEYNKDDGESNGNMKSNEDTKSIYNNPETTGLSRNEMDPYNDKIATDQVFENVLEPIKSTDKIERDNLEKPNLNRTHNTIVPQNIIPKINEEIYNEDQVNDNSELIDSVENAIPSLVQNQKIMKPVQSSEEYNKDDGESNEDTKSIYNTPETTGQSRNEMDPYNDKIATDQVFENVFEPIKRTDKVEQDNLEKPNLNRTHNTIVPQNIIPKINEEIYNEDQVNDNSELIDSVENAIPSLVQNQKIMKPVQSSEEYNKDDGESNEDTKSIYNTPETTGQSRNEMDPSNDKIATDQVFENVLEPIKSTDKIERDNLEKPNLNRTHNTIVPQNIIPKINEEIYNEDQVNDNSEKIDSVENAIPSLVQNQKIMKPVQSSEEYDKDDGESNGDMKSNEDTKSIYNTQETTGQSRNEMDPYNDKIATDQVFENVFEPIKRTDKVEQDNLEKPNLNRTHNTILPQTIIPKINEEIYNEDQVNDNSELIDSVENAIPSLVQNQKIMKPVQSSEEYDKDDGESNGDMKSNEDTKSIYNTPETTGQSRNEMDPYNDKIATDQVFENVFEPIKSTDKIERDNLEKPNLNRTHNTIVPQNIIPKINEEIYNEDQENDNSEKIDSVENAIPSLVQNQKIMKPVQSSEEYDKDDGESNEDTKSIYNTPETTGQSRNEMDPYNDKIATDQVFENVFEPIKSTDKIERDNLEKPNLNRTHNTILPQTIIPKINEEIYNEDQVNDNSELIDSVENAIPSLVQNQKIMKPVQSSEEYDKDDGESNEDTKSIYNTPETTGQSRNEMDPYNDKIATDQVFENVFEPIKRTDKVEQDNLEKPILNRTHNTILPQNIIPKINEEIYNEDQVNDNSEKIDSVENAIPSLVQNQKIMKPVQSSEEYDKDDGESNGDMKSNEDTKSIYNTPETTGQSRNEMDPYNDKIATDQVFENVFEPIKRTDKVEQDNLEKPNLNRTHNTIVPQNIIPKINEEIYNEDQVNDNSEKIDSVENAIPSLVQNQKIVKPDEDVGKNFDGINNNTFEPSSRLGEEQDNIKEPNLNSTNFIIPSTTQDIMPNTLLNGQISNKVKGDTSDDKDPSNKKIIRKEPNNGGLNKGLQTPGKKANIISETVVSNLGRDSSEALSGESIPKINKEVWKTVKENGSTEVLDSVEIATPSILQNVKIVKPGVSSKEYEKDQDEYKPVSQDKMKNNKDKENVLKNISAEIQLNNKIDVDNNNESDVGGKKISGKPTEVNHDKYEFPNIDDAKTRLHDNVLKNNLETGELVEPEKDSLDIPVNTKYINITEPINEIPEINGKEPTFNEITGTKNENFTNNQLNNSSEITNNIEDSHPSIDNKKIVNSMGSSNEYKEEPKSQTEPNNEDQTIMMKIPLPEEQPNIKVNADNQREFETSHLNNETDISDLRENMSEHTPTEDDLSDIERISSPVEGDSINGVDFDKQLGDGNRNELESPISANAISSEDFVPINDTAEEIPLKPELESTTYVEKPEVPFEQPNKKVKAKKYRKRRITYLVNKATGKRTAVKEEIIPIDTNETPKVSSENEIANQDKPKTAAVVDESDLNLFHNNNAEQCKNSAYERLKKIASNDIKKLAFSTILLSSKLRNNVMSDIKQANNDVKQSDLRDEVDQAVEKMRKAIDVNFKESIDEMRKKLVLLAKKFAETTNGVKNTYKVGPRTTHEMLSSIAFDPLPVSEATRAALNIISPDFNIDKAVRRTIEKRPTDGVKSLRNKKIDTQRKLIDLSELMDTAVNNFECLMLSVIGEIGVGVDTLKVLNSGRLMMNSHNPRAMALKNAMTVVQEILSAASGNQLGASAKFANRSLDSEPVAEMVKGLNNKQKPVGVIVVHPDMTIKYKQLPDKKELKKFVAKESKSYKNGKTTASPKFLKMDNKKIIQDIVNDVKKKAKQTGMTDAETVNEIVRHLNTKQSFE